MRASSTTRLPLCGLALLWFSMCILGFASLSTAQDAAQETADGMAAAPAPAVEQPKPPQPQSLDELLEMVREGFVATK